jgi:hypothetical protein
MGAAACPEIMVLTAPRDSSPNSVKTSVLEFLVEMPVRLRNIQFALADFAAT